MGRRTWLVVLLTAILVILPVWDMLAEHALQAAHDPHHHGNTAYGQGAWAYQQTFDSNPPAPQPFASPQLQVIVAGEMDGFTLDPNDPTHTIGSSQPISAGHGPHCEAPYGGTAATNNHLIPVSPATEPAYQSIIRPHLMYVCNGHMMTVAMGGYTVISFQPRQLFDWAGRTGLYQVDTSLYTHARTWWDTYIVPQDEMLLEIVHVNEGGTGEQLPKRGVRFTMVGAVPRVAVIDNYQLVYQSGAGPNLYQLLPNDPALSDPTIRRTVKMSLSQTAWKFEIEKADGTYYTLSDTFPQPLSFTRGLIRTEHHAYNPTKDGLTGTPWSMWTYHWDNLQFDGPVVPDRQASLPGPHFLDLWHASPGQVSAPVTINVPAGSGSGWLLGHVFSQLQTDAVDPTNTSHWRQFRLNGGPWQDLTLVKNTTTGTADRGWSTVRNALSGVVAGANTLEFRYNARPPQASWQADGFYIQNLEIQADSAGPVATATPTPPPPPGGCTLGDINCDGIVDVRDYGLWRQSFGANGCTNASDLNSDCIVDIRDYGVWRQNFGRTAGAAVSNAVPSLGSPSRATAPISTPAAQVTSPTLTPSVTATGAPSFRAPPTRP